MSTLPVVPNLTPSNTSTLLFPGLSPSLRVLDGSRPLELVSGHDLDTHLHLVAL